MKCIYCGTENEQDAKFCQACGARLETGEAVAEKAEAAAEEVTRDAELKLEENIDAHMAKIETELDEEDLSDVLTGQNGTQTYGNVQAQTVKPTIDLELPEHEEHKQKPQPTLVVPTSKTEELIAQKEKERQERQARIDAYEREKAKQEEARKAAQAKAQAEKQAQRPQQTQTTKQVNPEKMTAIIGYITWIGFAAAFFMTSSNRSDYMKNQLNRALILNLLTLIGRIIGRLIPFVGNLVSIATFVLWVMAVYYAASDSDKELPFVDTLHLLN
ncbi:MAG: zinc ribbon domain-containing protein [Solobacterium sp.]|nr:zinc ribbon domain-containing protein [Solobacterium sp.]